VVGLEGVHVPDSYVLSPSFKNLIHTIQVQKERHLSIKIGLILDSNLHLGQKNDGLVFFIDSFSTYDL
jgi:hypothetical protein